MSKLGDAFGGRYFVLYYERPGKRKVSKEFWTKIDAETYWKSIDASRKPIIVREDQTVGEIQGR